MFLLIINVLLLVVSESFSNDLPDYFPRCNLEDPNLNQCIAKAANTLRPYLRNGIKEIRFPSFKPLVISSLIAKQESSLVNYTMSVWNYTIGGLDNYDLTEVKYNPTSMTFSGRIEFTPVSLDVKYIMKGRLLNIPLDGNGDARAIFGPINGTYEINGEIIKRKGVEYYKPTSTKFRMVMEDGSYNFGGLFDGNSELERLTNEMVNANSKTITDAVTPLFEKQVEIGLMYLMKSLTQAVPYKKLFSSLN